MPGGSERFNPQKNAADMPDVGMPMQQDRLPLGHQPEQQHQSRKDQRTKQKKQEAKPEINPEQIGKTQQGLTEEPEPGSHQAQRRAKRAKKSGGHEVAKNQGLNTKRVKEQARNVFKKRINS